MISTDESANMYQRVTVAEKILLHLLFLDDVIVERYLPIEMAQEGI